MIVLDADVLLIDIRYPQDARFARNRQFLDRLKTESVAAGITSGTLLEVIGVLSFNLSAAHIAPLMNLLPLQYNLVVLPDLQHHPDYAGCTNVELVQQMSTQMALGDAVSALQVAKFVPGATHLVSWNARHFRGKLAVPAMTPDEWLLLP